MTSNNDETQEKGKNRGLESEALDGSENVIKPKADLKKVVRDIKKEMTDVEANSDKDTRIRVTIRIDSKKERTVGDLEWRWDLTKAKRFIRTGLIVAGLMDIDAYDVDGTTYKKIMTIHNKYGDIRKSFDTQAQDIVARNIEGTSGLKREFFLTESELGHISILSEVLGYTFEKLCDVLSSISLYNVEDISPRNRRNWHEDANDFIKFLDYRLASVENAWNMMNENKSNNN